MTPQRVQLRRVAGWRKPEGAVVVSRPSRFGNPYKVGVPVFQHHSGAPNPLWLPVLAMLGDVVREVNNLVFTAPSQVVELYRIHMFIQDDLDPTELAGKDLACWCPLTDAAGNRVPCHADILLELANPGWTP